MNIKLTESQYKLLKEFKKKAYSFDWDDNILIMPTRIHLDYRIGVTILLIPMVLTV